MLLKKTDERTNRLALLEDLQRSNLLDMRQKKWLRDELLRLRKGIQGERDSAYFLDQYFKDGENHVVLHDLRFVIDGDVAQIDHLIINRGNGIYLIETKNYAGNVSINAHGEFTVEYETERIGIESPIEQSQRHERVLHRLLDRLEISPRTGGPLPCHHLVMFHSKAIITRPAASAFDTSNVIKADQFPSWHQKFVNKEWGYGTFFKVAANLRSQNTIKEWGERLVRQHRPANQLDLPSFMLPAAEPRRCPPAAKPSNISTRPPIVDAVAAPEDAAPLCPTCRSAMVRRTAKKGINAGVQFWGCAQYPGCRGTR